LLGRFAKGVLGRSVHDFPAGKGLWQFGDPHFLDSWGNPPGMVQVVVEGFAAGLEIVR
jgi:hypothetical protein